MRIFIRKTSRAGAPHRVYSFVLNWHMRKTVDMRLGVKQNAKIFAIGEQNVANEN